MDFNLSLQFNSHFSRWTRLARVSRYQNISILDLLELRMTEVVVTTGAIRCAKLQSNRNQKQTNTQLFFTRWTSALPNKKNLAMSLDTASVMWL